MYVTCCQKPCRKSPSGHFMKYRPKTMLQINKNSNFQKSTDYFMGETEQIWQVMYIIFSLEFQHFQHRQTWQIIFWQLGWFPLSEWHILLIIRSPPPQKKVLFASCLITCTRYPIGNNALWEAQSVSTRIKWYLLCFCFWFLTNLLPLVSLRWLN